MLEDSSRISVCESEIKNIKIDIAELYVKGDETSKNYNKVNIDYAEMNLNLKSMTKSIDNMIVEMKQDRKINSDKLDIFEGRVEKMENKDGNTAKSIVKWIIENMGGIAVVLLSAFLLMKFGWK